MFTEGQGCNRVRKLWISNSKVQYIAGSKSSDSGVEDGYGHAARFHEPRGVAISEDGLFV